ncbi:hypothetical protein B0H65DRAFT_175762 [Neurospora tetraspora]|uniref:Uncharacterized protein n=1 Tax=Neurospora tetraspora TaxID=94610 RepID=A0AAE0JIV0_9PEZI|nr:hypothetical protein B0H65DRAFT_175762 [Neurospora tetraspora]
MDRFNFLPQGLRRNNPADSAANAAAASTAPTGTTDHPQTQPQPAPLPAVYNRNQNPYTYSDSVSSLSSDDEYENEDLYEDEVYSVSSRSSRDSVAPRSRQQQRGGQPNYPSSSTLNRSHDNMGNSMGNNNQDDLYCDLEAQLGIHPALRIPPGPGPGPGVGPGAGNGVPANFPPPPPIPQEEMTEVERRSSSRFFLPRMSFRFLGGGRPRPASSHYSGDGLPPATEVNFPVSPKSPAFRIGEQQLPSTRLHVPGVERTWSRGSNGPPTRDGSSQGRGNGRTVRVTEPRRTATRRHRSERDGERSERRREGSGRSRSGRSGSGAGTGSGSGSRHAASGHRSRSHRSRRDPGRSTTTGGHRDARDEERRRRRKKKSSSSRRQEGSGSGSGSHSRSATTTTSGGGGSSERRRKRAPPPKHFLFCFPWVKSRTKRMLILRSFVSGMFLACLLIVYLALAVTHTVDGSEFTIAMILVVVLGAIVFCHSVVRLIMLAFKGGRSKRGDLESGQAHHGLDIHAPAGPYAIPPTPIRVVLARDEEAAGIPSDAAVSKPPEYGQWRESVRVDPNRIYWMRNEAVTPALPNEEQAGSEGARSRAGSRDGPATNPGTLRRPPSYSSDDGVSYVVEAQPRSIAPATDVPPTGGRAGRRLA